MRSDQRAEMSHPTPEASAAARALVAQRRMVELVCSECQREFVGKTYRAVRRFCSDRCKQRDKYRRQKGGNGTETGHTATETATETGHL
jgi:type II secretory ATPase GspE/PulE/Tfp pilus assembly ATPase PilB-like protein